VRIGGLSGAQLFDAVRRSGVQLNQAAEALFADERFTTLEREQVVPIVARTVRELGFPNGAVYADLAARARELGCSECPLELGPHLRLQFTVQRDSDDGKPLTHGRAPAGSIAVASRPLDDRDDTPKGFYLRRLGDVLWLRGWRSSSDHVWSPEDVFVFARSDTA
jgi:hypothetical protein